MHLSIKANQCFVVLVWATACWAATAFAQSEPVTPDATSETEANMVSEAARLADDPAAANTPAQADNFDLLELRLKGNTLLDKKQLERTVYPFLGPHKSIDTVEQARAALEKLYQAQGYQTVTVDIPEQEVNNGIVYLQIVEGKVSRLRVKDAHYFSLGKIKASVPELAEGNVPHFPRMQAQLAALGAQSTDREVTPVLRAGEEPGTMEVDLKVKEQLPLHGRVELNSRNTSSTSRLRLVSSLRYENLWQAMHSASIMYQVAPENSDEVDVWAGTYSMPLLDDSSRLSFYTIHSSSNAQIASAGALSVIGIGEIYGLRFSRDLAMIDDYYHSVTLGVDYKNFGEDLKLIGADSIKTPISYLPFTLDYSGGFSGKDYRANFDLATHFAIRGLGNKPEEFQRKRDQAKADYLYTTGDFKLHYDLPLGMAVVGHFSGQWASSPLISNEQFSIGGAQTVRGYFETQALADYGMVGSLELYSPHLGKNDWAFLNDLKILGFVDGGKGWLKSVKTENQYSLSSVGAGLRFKLWQHLNGAFDVGVPLLTLAPIQSGNPRFHFSLATDF